MNLHNVNFANSDLRQSVFSDILGNITSLALTPDGKCSATADMDVDTHLWQVGKGKQLLTFHGQTIVSGSGDRKVKFWQIRFNPSTKSHAQSSWRDRKWRMSRMWATKY